MQADPQRVLDLLQQKVGQLTSELAVATALAGQWAERATVAESALADLLNPQPAPVGDESAQS